MSTLVSSCFATTMIVLTWTCLFAWAKISCCWSCSTESIAFRWLQKIAMNWKHNLIFALSAALKFNWKFRSRCHPLLKWHSIVMRGHQSFKFTVWVAINEPHWNSSDDAVMPCSQFCTRKPFKPIIRQLFPFSVEGIANATCANVAMRQADIRICSWETFNWYSNLALIKEKCFCTYDCFHADPLLFFCHKQETTESYSRWSSMPSALNFTYI